MNSLLLWNKTFKHVLYNPRKIAGLTTVQLRHFSQRQNEMAAVSLGDSSVRVMYANSHQLFSIPDKFSGKNSIPTYIAYTEKGILIGEEALQQQHTNPKNTIYGLRQLIGRNYDEVKSLPQFQNCPFEIQPSKNNNEVQIKFGPDFVSPKFLLSQLFTRLQENLQLTTQHPVSSSFFSVPAHFGDAQRYAIKSAANDAKFHIERMTNEPSVIAMSYQFKQPCSICHVNLGSSSTELILQNHEDGIYEVTATEGIPVGGDTIDEALVSYFKSSSLVHLEISKNSRDWFVLLRACETFKKQLSTEIEASGVVELSGSKYNLRISRETFLKIISPIVTEISDFIKTTTTTTDWKNIDRMIAYGGVANIPSVAKMLSSLSPNVEISSAPEEEVNTSLGNYGAVNFSFDDVPKRLVNSCGLYFNTTEHQPVPLSSINVNVEIIDLSAVVTVTQNFKTSGDMKETEACYLWPADSYAPVYKFSSKGAVLPTQVAKEKYKKAVKAGLGAFRMDKVSGDIMQMNVGNLKPNTDVSITIEYVTPLLSSSNLTTQFFLPTLVPAPYDRNPGKYYDSTLPSTREVPTFLKIKCTASREISSVESSTHIMEDIKLDGNNAIAEFSHIRLDRHFDLNINLKEPLANFAIVSNDPAFGSPAMFATISKPQIPQQNTELKDKPKEFVFLLDRSGSMGGQCIEQARQAVKLFVKNIVSFGSNFEKLFDSSQPYTEENVKKAVSELAVMDADLGGTEILAPIVDVLNLPPIMNGDTKLSRRIMLITDGEVTNTDDVIDYISTCRNGAQISALGIGNDSSRHLISGVADAGCGKHDMVWENNLIAKKVIQLLKFTQENNFVTSLELVYTHEGSKQEGKAEVVQKFPLEDKWLLLANAPGLPLDSKIFVKANFENGASDLTEISPLYIQDNRMQLLATHSKIRQMEKKSNLKQEIIKLSTKFNLMSSYTSFLVVEDSPEDPSKPKLLANTSITEEKMASLKETEDYEIVEEEEEEENNLTYQFEGKKVLKSRVETYVPSGSRLCGSIQSLLLLDVTPVSVGIKKPESEEMITVIPRNTTIPTRKSTILIYNYIPGVPATLSILRENNPSPTIIAVPVAENEIERKIILEITFDIDGNGIWSVIVENKDSGQKTEMKVSLYQPTPSFGSNSIPSGGYFNTTNAVGASEPQPVTVHSDNTKMMELISMQRIDGLWELDESFANFFGDNLKTLQSHSDILKIKNLVGNDHEMVEKVFATYLAISYLKQHEKDKEDEWELVVAKSTDKLKSIIGKENLVESNNGILSKLKKLISKFIPK